MVAGSSLPSPPLLITDLAKSVPGGRVLFAGLNLCMAPGEIVAIMGESGVGKSTLLNLFAGLDQADRGRIEIDGVDLAALNEEARTGLRRDRIGFVFQAFHILPHLTLAQNVALPLVLARQRQAHALAEANLMLGQVGLPGRGGDFPAQVSGGEMQRIALARALVHSPALVLADEPTGNLDPQTAETILTLLCDRVRASGAAAVIVTHSERAAAAADRVLTLTAQGLAVHGD
ncbi:MAG: ABC transporter ATP-binding protein [Phenylobacterium sp.]|uniref:ABC transporter ATP-binding protein n=1 Tax=Phenylobacterium sp. TaxID=1871053 RepID=UPI00271FDB28|nr:ABC transporter ATP-binding protein [Phenylobacterium sp.]MDO8899809.1 ABC transporter ATP-binding protein [Phenylobacterium sp.]